MKIIQSNAGGGKTNELARVAAEYTQKGKKAHFITDEMNVNDFKYYLNKNNVDANYLEFSEIETIPELMGKIFEDNGSDVLLIDVHSFTFNKNMPEEIKMLFKSIEKLIDKSIYITRQVNMAGHLTTTEI